MKKYAYGYINNFYCMPHIIDIKNETFKKIEYYLDLIKTRYYDGYNGHDIEIYSGKINNIKFKEVIKEQVVQQFFLNEIVYEKEQVSDPVPLLGEIDNDFFIDIITGNKYKIVKPDNVDTGNKKLVLLDDIEVFIEYVDSIEMVNTLKNFSDVDFERYIKTTNLFRKLIQNYTKDINSFLNKTKTEEEQMERLNEKYINDIKEKYNKKR